MTAREPPTFSVSPSLFPIFTMPQTTALVETVCSSRGHTATRSPGRLPAHRPLQLSQCSTPCPQQPTSPCHCVPAPNFGKEPPAQQEAAEDSRNPGRICPWTSFPLSVLPILSQSSSSPHCHVLVPNLSRDSPDQPQAQ